MCRKTDLKFETLPFFEMFFFFFFTVRVYSIARNDTASSNVS